MPQLYTDKLLMNLPSIFNAKTAFAAFMAPVQSLDGVANGTKAFTVKRSATPVVINSYNDDTDLNDGKSRFGDINEIKYGDLDVDYDFQDALNEAIDKFTVNAEEQQAVADRHELQATAITRHTNVRFAKYANKVAGKSFTLVDYSAENVAKLFDQMSAYFKNIEVDAKLYAYVTPNLFNAMVALIQFKSLVGATVDVNNDQLVNYKGFVVQAEADRYFTAKDIAYVGAEKINIPFIGIEISRTIDSEKFAGQLLQTATRGGNYIHEDNRIALAKVELTADIEPSGIEVAPKTMTLKVRATKKIVPTVTPDGAKTKTVTYASDNQAAATVATDGTVTGVAKGKATVTSKTVNGLQATTVVTVEDAD